jgi:hypothetical protein
MEFTAWVRFHGRLSVARIQDAIDVDAHPLVVSLYRDVVPFIRFQNSL